MTRWEYKQVVCDGKDLGKYDKYIKIDGGIYETVKDYFNVVGLAGWQLVSIFVVDDETYFHFKRPIENK